MLDGLMMDVPLLLSHFLERSRSLFPESTVVSRRGDGSVGRTTYREVYARSAQLAHALVALGVKKGDRVATLAWNHAGHLEAYAAIPSMGAILHTLNLRLHPTELAYIASHAEDQVVIVDHCLVPLLEKFLPDASSIRHVVVWRDPGDPEIADGAKLGAAALHDYEALLAGHAEEYAWPRLDERAGAILCYTSGTTGHPKGVCFTHRSTVLHTIAACMADTLAVGEGDVVFPVVPMFHANAWGLPYAAMLTGAGLVFPGPKLDAVSLLDAMEKEKVTLAGGVPTIWLAILAELDKAPTRFQLGALDRMVIGGSAAPPALIDGFAKRHGLKVIHAWGMTELNPLGTLARIKRNDNDLAPEKKLALAATQGYPVPFVDVRHVTDDGRILPRDGKEMGELEVRGPWVASAYVGGAGKDRFTEDGWFKTGDVVTLDDGGYVRITDRSKDVIKSGGEWISSVDLENALMAHPAVLEAAVFAGADEKWSERPVAAIVWKPGMKAEESELSAFLAERFPKFWLPDAYVTVPQVPRTSTGKFLKSKLREEYGGILQKQR